MTGLNRLDRLERLEPLPVSAAAPPPAAPPAASARPWRPHATDRPDRPERLNRVDRGHPRPPEPAGAPDRPSASRQPGRTPPRDTAGSGFAPLLRDLRQLLAPPGRPGAASGHPAAADPDGRGGTHAPAGTTGAPALVALSIGPGLTAITTPGAEAADAESLARYARAQGLPPSVVEALLRDEAGPDEADAAPPTGATSPDAAALGAWSYWMQGVLPPPASAASGSPAVGTAAVASAGGVAPSPGIALTAGLGAGAAADATAATDRAPGATGAWRGVVGGEMGGLPVGAPGSAPGGALTLASSVAPDGTASATPHGPSLTTAGAAGVASPLSASGLGGGAVPSPPGADGGTVALPPEVGAEPGRPDALAGPGTAGALRPGAGDGGSASAAAALAAADPSAPGTSLSNSLSTPLPAALQPGWGGKVATLGTPAAGIAAEVTALDDAASASLAAADGPRPDAGWPAAGVGAPTANAALAAAADTPAATAASVADQLAEHITRQVEEHRATQARVAAGLALHRSRDDGDWTLRLSLRPDALGAVQVELRLQDGQLSGDFSSASASTRALLHEGLGRLREQLQQHGMAVAGLGVDGSAAGRSNGNPTPRPGGGRVDTEERRRSGRGGDEAVGALTPATRRRDAERGIDLWV